MNQAVAVSSASNLQLLIEQLESTTCGEDAINALVGYGCSAILVLAEFLLYGKPRTIATPRCRMARALGLLGLQHTVFDYFKGYKRSEDLSVLSAEDAIRTSSALEPNRWKSRHKHKQFFEVWLQLKNTNGEGSSTVFSAPFAGSQKMSRHTYAGQGVTCRANFVTF